MSKIVVIAHDNYKPNLLDFLKERKSWFFGRQIVATGRTAEFLENGKLNLPLIHVNKGSNGGYLQIVEMIKNGEVAIVFFFRDANIVQPYHDDIYKLLNTCDLLDIPIQGKSNCWENIFAPVIEPLPPITINASIL